MKNNIQIVSVVRNFDVYHETVKENPFVNDYQLHYYDNSTENIGIPTRYNDFILNHMGHNSWLIFCHQDFAILEDPWPKLKQLNDNFIYGPIGARRKYGIFFRNFKIHSTRKMIVGQINQASKKNDFYKNGKFLKRPKTVDTVDCCCVMVRASLIRRCNLRFDENLAFHLYSEEFSLHAKHNYGIKTKAVQFDCKHLSSYYDPPPDFYESLEYVKKKYGGRTFFGTCND